MYIHHCTLTSTTYRHHPTTLSWSLDTVDACRSVRRDSVDLGRSRSSSEQKEEQKGSSIASANFQRTERTMLHPLSYQLYRSEHQYRYENRISAATQRPAAPAQFTEPSGPPAWRTIPSWSLIGTQDRVIPRADRKSTRLNSSHIQKSRMPSSA